MKSLIAAAAVLAAGLACPVSASADHGRTSDRVNLRYGPSLEYRPVVVIPRGRPVEVRRCTPGHEWCEVHYGRYVGWVRADFLLHPRFGRPYNVLGPELTLPVFDFFGHIEDYDRDRRYRLREYRHDDDWYRERLRRGGERRYDRERGYEERGRYRGGPDEEDERRYAPGPEEEDEEFEEYEDDRYRRGEPPEGGWERGEPDDDVEGTDDE